MKLSEAREIVGKMILWGMIAQGIEPTKRPDAIKEDLATLLKANKMVVTANERSKKRIDKIVAEKGSYSGKRSVSLTIADRGIAAIYVAANFKGDGSNDANVLAMHYDNMVFCLNKNRIED